jgi:predicted  nucleic acid-binding Zn-ribbon protein
LKDRESELRAQATAATSALAEVESSIDAGLLDLASTREQLIASLPSALVNRYEQVRAKLGVAAAMLTGSKCEGCHLDLSPAEVDEVRRAPADVLPDCPQCGRLLVR